MKKLMMVLLIGVLVLAMSAMGFASEGTIHTGKSQSASAGLKAIVHPYTSVVIYNCEIVPNVTTLYFTGAANAPAQTGFFKYEVECNYTCDITGSGSPNLTTTYNGQQYALPVTYDVSAANFGTGILYNGPGKVVKGKVSFTVQTGNQISSQPAGVYTGQYDITVSCTWDDAANGYLGAEVN